MVHPLKMWGSRRQDISVDKLTIQHKWRRNKCFRVEEFVDAAADASASTGIVECRPGARLAVVKYEAGPKSVPAALSKILNGSPDWSVTTPEKAHPSANLPTKSLLRSTSWGRLHV